MGVVNPSYMYMYIIKIRGGGELSQEELKLSSLLIALYILQSTCTCTYCATTVCIMQYVSSQQCTMNEIVSRRSLLCLSCMEKGVHYVQCKCYCTCSLSPPPVSISYNILYCCLHDCIMHRNTCFNFLLLFTCIMS